MCPLFRLPNFGFRLPANRNRCDSPEARRPKPTLRCCFHLLCRFQYFLDGALHVKSLLGDVIVFAFDDGFETLHCVGDFDVASCGPGELLGDVEGLRQEALNFSCARHSEFLIFAELVDAENRDDILQVFISLESLLYRLSDVVVFLADDSRIENARGGSQRIACTEVTEPFLVEVMRSCNSPISVARFGW